MTQYYDINSSESATIYTQATMRGPYAMLMPPHFAMEGLEPPQPIYFWTKKEAEDFLRKLPKDWLVSLVINKAEENQ